MAETRRMTAEALGTSVRRRSRRTRPQQRQTASLLGRLRGRLVHARLTAKQLLHDSERCAVRHAKNIGHSMVKVLLRGSLLAMADRPATLLSSCCQRNPLHCHRPRTCPHDSPT